MAEYEISHPRIPQIGNIVLEGPDDLPPPTEKDFWEVVQQQVRPLGLSQLTDEEKISAYKNGYFSEPKPLEGQPEQPGIIDGLLDLGGKAVLRGLQISKTLTGGTLSPDLGIGISGPYDKLLRLPDKAVPYEKTENVDQFREAGKYLFGFLDNTEDKLDFDPVTEALKRTGMPFYSKNKDARGRVKAAAMDYAQDSMVAGMGEGYIRAASGGEFIYKGGKFLKDKLLLDEADDSDVLDYVNSSIEFDALNHRYENSAELAAFVLENPQESAKAMVSGLVGGLTPIVEAEDLNEILINEEDINLDSDLQQDIRSGFVQPDVGLSFLTEVVGDPMNLAGGTLAKGVTAPQRVALSGRISKTLKEVNILNKAKASTIKYLDKLPEQSAMHQRVGSRLVELNAELLEKQKIVDKYARNSLFLRMAAQSSPDELLKVAAKNLDTATDAGKLSMNMVYNAMKPNGKIGLVRKGIAMGAKLTPEIAGATIGASLAGPEGAAAGALAPSILKGAKILSTMPENVAISYIMRSATEAGEEITEQAARKQYRQFTNKILYPTGILGLGGGALLGGQEGGGGLSDSLLKIGGGAFALKFLPKLAKFSDAAVRDSRVIGPELIYARGENSPFFNRLALLPSADEGLIGANADRFQALTRTSSGATILEKAIDKVRPIGRGIATSVTDEFPTGAPFRPGLSNTNKMLSSPTRKVAQFLDRTPTLGRGIETLGRFGTVVTAGSTLPAAFGYVGSGGQAEGALAGVLVSAPFTSIGAGAGMYQTFKNKGDLFQQKMGDVHYYREHLNKSEQADFDALPMHIRMALSGYSLSHPDVIFQPGTEGQGNFSFNPDLQTSVIEYNKATGAGLIEGVLAHEVGHHIEIHGLTPMVNKLFFGDPVTKEGGVYGKYNDEGEIVPNKEFTDLRDFYLRKLSGDDSINPADADRYQGKEGQQLLVSELFAEQVRDYLLSGKKDKGNTVAEKIVRASSEAMMGTPFIRDFLLKMNLPMKADGKFIEGGFFEGKLRRIPEITKLIDQYYKDTRAMRQREIQGDEVTTPGTNRVDKELSIDPRKAKRPIDQGDFESSFSIKDQNDPAVRAKLDTGGIFKWRPTADGGSELETGPTGTPKRYTAKELEKQNRAQGDHAIKVFEKHGVDIITHKDGKKSTGEITNLTPEMIDDLAQGPWHPRQIQTLREISRSLREGDGERAGFLIGYFAASTGRKPKAVPFALRQEMPYGFKLTKDGNILALLHDVPQLEKNLKFLKGGRRLPGKYRDEYNQLFDNDTEVWEAFRQYRVNTANGMDGQLGLDDDPARAIRKKNFLNALHGAIDTEHINLNPILSEISKLKGMDMFNPSKRQPFGPATKTFRLDRIFDVTRSGNRNSNVNVDRVKKLLMPTEIQEGSPGSFFRPKSSRDKSARLRTFKSPVYLKDGSRLSGVADNPEQNPFYGYDKNGQEFSQRREYVNPQDITKSRDSDRTANQIRNELESGQKLFHPAYHGTPHTFAPEPGAPFGKFRTSAIGTGEGAQAYGHGLYFAGKKEVAEFYREQLAPTITKDFKVGTMNIFKDEVPMDYSPDKLERVYGKEANARASLIEELMIDEGTIRRAFIEDGEKGAKREVKKVIESFLDSYEGEADYIKVGKKALDMPVKFDTTEPGSLYKVELAPKENEYLLWDKPLSEQPKGVREKLIQDEKLFKELESVHKKVKEEHNDRKDYDGQTQEFKDLTNKQQQIIDELGGIIHPSWTGANIYHKLTGQIPGRTLKLNQDANTNTQQAASQFLKEAGIPGIKYLDGSSRSKGEGDYNYVIFDEADVQITDKLFMPMSKDDNLIKSLETKGHKFTGHPMLQAGQLIMDGKVVLELGTDFSGNLELAGIRALEKGAGIPALKSILNTAKENEMAVTGFAEAFGNTDPNAPKLSQERLESLYKRLGGEINSYGKVVFNKEFLKKRRVKLKGFGDKLFMPASEAGAGKGKVPKSGDMLTLDDKSLKLFLPSPGNPNASLSEFKGKNVQVLTTDLSMVGDKKIDGATVAFTGGPGYLSVNDAWGFTNESSAKGFRTRWEREGRPLIGLTSMKQDNHKASTLTREYYVRKFMQAINQGKIAEKEVNNFIKAALKKVIDGKNGLTKDQRIVLGKVKTIEDFLTVFTDKELIPWKASPFIYEKLNLTRGLPIKQARLKELGLDLDTILRETRQKEYNDIKKGSLLAIAEYDGSDAVYRPDLNSAYPWSVPFKEKAFLKDFADIQDLSSRQDLRGSDGEANIGVAMGAGIMLDRLGRGDVNFMPSGRPTRQPANRITRQAPAMPGNRFMLPAVSAGAKSAERFR